MRGKIHGTWKSRGAWVFGPNYFEGVLEVARKSKGGSLLSCFIAFLTIFWTLPPSPSLCESIIDRNSQVILGWNQYCSFTWNPYHNEKQFEEPNFNRLLKLRIVTSLALYNINYRKHDKYNPQFQYRNLRSIIFRIWTISYTDYRFRFFMFVT